MKRIGSMLVVALVLQTGDAPCSAQKLVSGQRVRVKAPSISRHAFFGSIVRITADTLFVEKKTLRKVRVAAVPIDAVTKLEISRGKRGNAGKGFVAGSLIGGVIGVGFSKMKLFGEEIGPAPIFVFGGGGALIGICFGVMTSTDRWEVTSLKRLRLGISPQRNRTIQLSVALGP